MKQVLVNADDFGWDQETYTETVRLINIGAVTSATIMVGLPLTQKAIDFAKERQDQISFGLHFNIVDGMRPLAKEFRGLCNSHGVFRRSHLQRICALFNLIRPEELLAELRAQLEFLLASGLKVSHVDSHGHLHKFPALSRVIAPVLREYGITKMRRPQNIHATWSISNIVDHYSSAFFPREVVSTDYFSAIDRPSSTWSSDFVSGLRDGTTELSVHPGTHESWRVNEVLSLLQLSDYCTRSGLSMINYYNI